MQVPASEISADVRTALAEDIGSGDVTASLIPADSRATARIVCREPAVLCGTAWFNESFAQLDNDIEISWQASDGDSIAADTVICTLSGPARSLLSGERTAINFLQTLSGIATTARQWADKLDGLDTKILDTRKTIPGLRLAQKYAVTCGGCENHRIGLYDAILIKENHIAAAGSIAVAVTQARQDHPQLLLEVEVENLDELQQALDAGVDRVLLDNFPPELLIQAVSLNNNQVHLEASGNITLDNVRSIAETGVNFISTGALTKHLQAIDFSMRID